MRMLAIDQSSMLNSLVLTVDGSVVSDASWEASFHNNRALFEWMRHVLERARVRPDEIDAFAVGTGPGSFTGLRCAVAAFRALALPGNRPVVGISSALAIAQARIGASDGRLVVVVGDARRNRAWHAAFRADSGHAVAVSAPSLAPVAGLAEQLPGPSVVIGPDWERIGDVLRRALAGAGAELVEQSCYPQAVTIAELAASRLESGEPIPPPLPIYLHPPVFVEPRHPA